MVSQNSNKKLFYFLISKAFSFTRLKLSLAKFTKAMIFYPYLKTSNSYDTIYYRLPKIFRIESGIPKFKQKIVLLLNIKGFFVYEA